MNRNDYIVLDTVKGEAERISILFGLIQIIDGDKKKILWIPFYNEKYSYAFEGVASMENRAYHNALGQIPDADSVISTRYQKETGGLPILFRTEKVTFTGKAVKIKTDAEKERGMD
uniref:Uncharacterized protein n=1 Tax=Candidatus Kentrum sp. LFY TaxID=2126342 RepID=A0A450UNA1_9GAMM|nr:MAG: hypothetical protein BECKLFY1418A_GA0070994_103615 [Candidatus Kentron sp. LFY]